MTTVAAFLQAQARVPFQFGASDCCLFIADYVLHVDGVDHGAELRGTYSTKVGAHRVMTREKGLLNIIDRSGWERSDSPTEGGIVIIGDNPLVPAIYHDGGFYFKAGTGGVAFIAQAVAGTCWRRP